ncbi:dodecin family protein [Luteimonas sp. FXH3W]|jgi:hypothetical protein|uniref:Dodecin family protein n=1 Tax=Aquilutibacter rugosus TaxID=3115820 RepID=A0ABU7UZB1_9GAMM
MSVAKVIEVSSSSEIGVEDAVRKGLLKVAETVKNIKGAWIAEQKVVTNADGSVATWHVNLRITFVVD